MERLLTVLFAPLLMAATQKKKTKPAKRPAAKAKPARPAKKATPKKSPAPVKPKPAKEDKPKGKLIKVPAQPTTVAKAQSAEPTPKPPAPTGRAILIFPENDKFTDSVHPTFRWLSVGGASRYEIAWSETADFAHPVSVISISTEATVPVEKPLRIGGTFYWRVRGGNEGGWGPWSSSASFRVLEGNE